MRYLPDGTCIDDEPPDDPNDPDADPNADDPELRDGVWTKCNECGKDFRIYYDDWEPKPKIPRTLTVAACESGGIYNIDVRCPHCNHKENIY